MFVKIGNSFYNLDNIIEVQIREDVVVMRDNAGVIIREWIEPSETDKVRQLFEHLSITLEEVKEWK